MGREQLKLLVSVTNRREALRAVEGGAHIIDVKNPREGSLGANFPRVIRQVREVVPKEVEVSATIGDLPNLPGTASLAALGAAVSGADYVKAGLLGVKTPSEAISLMKEICRAAKESDVAPKVIAAGYADFKKIGCLNPLKLPEIAYKVEADGVLADVKIKSCGKLFDLLSDGELREFVNRSHKYNLTVALAGSLDKDDIPRVLSLGADVIGVRRAVCSGRDRLKGEIQRKAVKEFAEAIDACKKRLGCDSRANSLPVF
jgi:uncharacterized protein (UPF0264 family)